MSERDQTGKRQDQTPGSDRQSASHDLAPAEGQEGSLKVHGDKLEKLIPKEQGKSD